MFNERPSFEIKTCIFKPEQYDQDHSWGYEIRLVNTPDYCLKKFVLFGHPKGKPAKRLHYHKDKTETFVIECGKVLLTVGDRDITMNPGDSFTIKPGIQHTFFSLTKLSLMLEVSTHHEDSDTYREDQ